MRKITMLFCSLLIAAPGFAFAGRAAPAAQAKRCCVRKSAFFSAKTPALYRRGDWGAALGIRFSARAEFSAEDGCSCSCCEFRQNIRGQYAVNGREVHHELSPGQLLNGDWHEDGGVERDGARDRPYEEVFFGPKDGEVLNIGRYGHRDDQHYDGTMDRYVSDAPPYELDRANGCSYTMNDMPVLQGRIGDLITMKTDFEQSIVDVCNGGAAVASGTLSVDKTWTANEADINSQGD